MPPGAQRGGGPTQTRGGNGLRNPGIQPQLWQLITHFSRMLNLDPYAVAAVSRVEGGGRFGEVGDSGSSFGPFQLHVGGALPAGRDAAWANSPAGVLYAMRDMARSGAAGLRGLPAVQAIVTRFERPANPSGEVSSAWSGYRSFGAPLPQGGGGGYPGMGGGLQISQLLAGQAAMQRLMASQFQQSQQSMLAQMARQAAMQRQQQLGLASASALQQRQQGALQAQRNLTTPGVGLPTDPTAALLEQRRQRLADVRQQALSRVGLG